MDTSSNKQTENHPLTTKNNISTSSSYQAATSNEHHSSSHANCNYKIGSLDFERVINQHSIDAVRKRFYNANHDEHTNPSSRKDAYHSVVSSSRRRRLLGFTGRTLTRWILTIIASLLTGLTSIGLVICTSSMVEYRSTILHSAVGEENWEHSGRVFKSYLLTNLSLALCSCVLCVYFVPNAAGSGIPEVKAYLNGVRSMHKIASIKLFIVKVVGTILSVSSGLSVGQEGPLIHIGAIMGASCTKFGGFLQNALIHWNSKWHRHCGRLSRGEDEESHRKSWTERLLSWTMKELSHFATDAERRDLVSIGASVGFAASFGSPIGGLLFILDDVSCYFERRLLLRMLIGNAVGTLCLAIKHRDFSNFGIIGLGTFDPNEIFETRLLETPLYLLIGIGGGLLGGCFCGSYLWLQQNITGRFPSAQKQRARCQLLAVAIVSILTSIILFYLPTLSWACKDIPRDVPAEVLANYELQQKKRFFCPHGQVNEMATIMFGSRITAIKDILIDPTSYQQRTLLVVGLTFYTLTLITTAFCTMPLGLFTPTILVGASLGGACGNLFKQTIDEGIFPSTFALLGVASMLAGIQHSTVSIAVILVEGTGHIKVLLPVIVVVATSRYISQQIQQFDVFEAGITIKKLAYLEHEKVPRYYDAIAVKDIIIGSHVFCLEDHETVGKLVEVLSNSSYQSFPVVERGSGRFIGLVKRTQIAALLECGIFSENKENRHEAAGNEDALSYWAFCINDDRYEYLLSLPNEELSSMRASKIVNTRQLSLRRRSSSFTFTRSPSEVSQDFCVVHRNESGSIVVSVMNSYYNSYWVDLASVANTGTYTVTEFFPVSKAYSLFTAIGLSHIVVLNGKGIVVGVLSRANFLPEHIEASSGL